MKVTQIFGLVLLFHLVAISLILLQPGCQTRQPPPPPDAGNEVRPATLEPPTASTRATGDYVPQGSRQQPSRPTGGRASATPGSGSGGLDPAFNAGLTAAGNPILQPTLEPIAGSDQGDTAGQTYYTVVAGDNLSRIAREFGVTVNAIKAANHLTSNTIRVGQDLTIPAPSAPTQNASVDAAGSEVHTVGPGDTLSGIATRFGVTVTDLKSNNGLTSDTIRVGQDLYIPGSRRASALSASGGSGGSGTRSQPVANSGSTYTVQRGDTPSAIARRFGVDYRELMRVNNIASANRMQLGQELIIPGGGRQPEPSTQASSNQSREQSRPPDPRATASQSRPAALNPQPSQPARIGEEDPFLSDPFDDFDLLENADIPLMEVEVVDEPEDGAQ